MNSRIPQPAAPTLRFSIKATHGQKVRIYKGQATAETPDAPHTLIEMLTAALIGIAEENAFPDETRSIEIKATIA